MKNAALHDFISHARDKGMDHQTIRMLLLSAGWKEKDIAGALASESLTMPVPSPADAGSARDAFLHLVAFATLYTTVVGLIVLSFQYINKLFPDPAEFVYYDGSSSTIRWSMASIIVSFPIFLYVSRILYRECSVHHEKLLSGVRRWLTYLTLFITSMTLIGDVITLIFFFLDGELTTRFLLKTVTVFLLAGIPFAYYFRTLHMEPEQYAQSSIHRNFRWLAIVLVLTAFVSGLFVVGSPNTGRDQRLDETRLQHLQQIQNEVYNYVYDVDVLGYPEDREIVRPLPPTLKPVIEHIQRRRLITEDPQTSEPYDYQLIDEGFRLCATFALERDLDYDVFWNHPAGYHCFDFDIDDLRLR